MRPAPAALALLAIGLAGAAAFLSMQLGEERSRGDALQARIDELENALRREAARTGRPPAPPPVTDAAAPGPPQAAPIAAVASVGGAVSAPLGDSPGAAAAVSRMSGRAELLLDPAGRAALRQQQLAALRRAFPELARELQLTPEQAEQFLAATVDQQMRLMDANRELAAAGLAPGSGEQQEMRRRMQQLQREGELELEAQFGAPTMQRWKAYQESVPSRMEVRELQVELVDAGFPLSIEQRQRLVDVLVRERRAMQQPSGATSSPGSSSAARLNEPAGVAAAMQANVVRAEESYRRVRDGAAQVLTAEQFARFDQAQRDRLDMMRASAELARQRAALVPPSTGSAAAPAP
jgi:hypothetical protein